MRGRDKERERRKERKKRGNRKYGQARLKASKKGVLSCVIAGGVFVVLLGLVVLTYLLKGKASGYIGGIGLGTLVFSCVGIGNAVRGFREREKDYRPCKWGLGLNIFWLLCFATFFLGGLL